MCTKYSLWTGGTLMKSKTDNRTRVRPPDAFRIVLCFEISQNYHRQALGGVLNYVRESSGLDVVTLVGMPVHSGARLKVLRGDAVLGFIYHQNLSAFSYWRHRPGVSVANVPTGNRLSVVCSDDHAVGELAAKHFSSLGMTDVACLGPWPGYAVARANGFLAGVKRSGMDCSVFEPNSRDWKLERLPELESDLSVWIDQLKRPCGIYCVDDRMASAVHALVIKKGIKIPGEIAILGTDNDEILLDLLNNPLSSIELNGQRVGYEAARLLHQQLKGEVAIPARIEIPPLRVAPRISTNLALGCDSATQEILARMHKAPGHPWTVEELIRGLGVSRRLAEQRFKAQLRSGIYDRLIEIRIENAKSLLLEGNRSIGLIAEQTGFCDQRQLGIHFKKRTGMTPSSFRKGEQFLPGKIETPG